VGWGHVFRKKLKMVLKGLKNNKVADKDSIKNDL